MAKLIYLILFLSLSVNADVNNTIPSISFFDLAARPNDFNKSKVSMYGYIAEDNGTYFLYFNEYAYRMQGKEKVILFEKPEGKWMLRKIVGCSVKLLGALSSLEKDMAASLNFMGTLEVLEHPGFVSHGNYLDCERRSAPKQP